MIARDFLTLAKQLVRRTDEAAWRSGVSRAYYAGFHVAREWLTALRFRVPQRDRAHAYLWLRLQNCGDAPVELAASDLNVLRSKRNWADYDLSRSLTQREAADLFLVAERSILALEAAAADPARAAAIEAEMARYESVILQDPTHTP